MAVTKSFRTPAELRRWFARHHETHEELILVYHKVGSETPSVTWPQSVDEALCVGWIDGIRRSMGPLRYSIRFTPRRPKSVWSAINVRRVSELEAEGRMQAAGLKVFAARGEKHAVGYSYQRRDAAFSPGFLARLKKNKAAWKFFESRAPSYRRLMAYWVMSAKQEATRERRLERLLAACVAGKIL